jgi:hypothetical protein
VIRQSRIAVNPPEPLNKNKKTARLPRKERARRRSKETTMYFNEDPTCYETRNGRTLPTHPQPRELPHEKSIREGVYGTVAFGDYFDGIVVFHTGETEVRVNGETVYTHVLKNRCIDWATRHGLAFTKPQARVLASVPRYGVDTYRESQKEMFGAFSDAGLSREKDTMLSLINTMLGTDFDSRTQMSEREMRLVAAAVRGGYFEEVAQSRAA